MPHLYTVTVTRQRDPRGGEDPELSAILAQERILPADSTPGSDSARADSGQAGGGVAAFRDDVYFLSLPSPDSDSLTRFATDFLAGDPSQTCHVAAEVELPQRAPDESVIIVRRKAGVMDPIEESVRHALSDAGYEAASCTVRTAQRFRLRGFGAGRDELERLARNHLANAVVDDYHCFLPGETEQLSSPFQSSSRAKGGRVEVALLELDDEALAALSRDGGLSLALEEMRAIQAHYQSLGRQPTDVELETLAQTWSEHCCHKTLTGPIDYDGERIENLLKETIFGVTRELDAPFCLSVFKDNAGVIALDDEWALTFKVETHNHPSALEPYGGAGTGIGGVIRDTLGTGLGARPILNTDVFCFAPLDTPAEQLPPGSLPPPRLLSGVVSGVRDYGNRMGIPTANGSIVFHPGYVGNPLVFCGSLGLIPCDKVDKEVQPGDLIVAIGGRTGRDGIHGATFSSRELTEDSETVSAGAVQIGNPIEEKKVQDALLRARDEGLYRAVTDCGAGGFSSAVGEMGEEGGAVVELDRAPLKYEGLEPREIWISEAQERMVLSVPSEHQARLFEILDEEEVEGCVLGTFSGDGILRLNYAGETVGELSMKFLHDGRPALGLQAARPERPARVEPQLESVALSEMLEELLSHPSVASKEAVIRQYDHEVQGRLVTRPLMGERRDAPTDGIALDPLRDGRFTVVVGCGIHPYLGAIDPYQLGAQAVDEAVRNVVSTGGTLERLALLDNFAWGNVHDPAILGAVIECARGASDAARAYGAPFVSGKDSLHNTYRSGGVSRSIPHTLLVSAVSITEGPPMSPSTDAKQAGSRLVLLGPPARMGASLLEFVYGGVGGEIAPFDGALGKKVLEQLVSWIKDGKVLSCHDLSDGGLGVAAAELGFGGSGQGVEIDLAGLPDASRPVAELLFGEGPHRFLLEVRAEDLEVVLAASPAVPVHALGEVNDSGKLLVKNGDQACLEADLVFLRDRWKSPLKTVWS